MSQRRTQNRASQFPARDRNSQSSTRTTTDSQGSSQSSSHTYVPLGHDDRNSPRTQAWRDTPPSSQQYSGWNREERTRYRDEVARNASGSLQTEVELRRNNENMWQSRYRDLHDEYSSLRARPTPEPRIVRLAAIRHEDRLGSQASTQRSNSNDSWSQRTDSTSRRSSRDD